jgi:uncharacterized protein
MGDLVQDRLICAVRNGCLATVEQLVDSGEITDYKIYNMALLRSVSVGNLDIIKTLVRGGGNINCVDKRHRSVLMIAISKKNISLILELIKIGSYINMCDDEGMTPLMMAIIYGLNIVVDSLLKNPIINVNMTDIYGNTALIYAVRHNRNDTVHSLVEHDAIIIRNNLKGKGPLYYAITNGNSEIFRYLNDIICRES